MKGKYCFILAIFIIFTITFATGCSGDLGATFSSNGNTGKLSFADEKKAVPGNFSIAQGDFVAKTKILGEMEAAGVYIDKIGENHLKVVVEGILQEYRLAEDYKQMFHQNPPLRSLIIVFNYYRDQQSNELVLTGVDQIKSKAIMEYHEIINGIQGGEGRYYSQYWEEIIDLYKTLDVTRLYENF